jgi:hypothetical protein
MFLAGLGQSVQAVAGSLQNWRKNYQCRCQSGGPEARRERPLPSRMWSPNPKSFLEAFPTLNTLIRRRTRIQNRLVLEKSWLSLLNLAALSAERKQAHGVGLESEPRTDPLRNTESNRWPPAAHLGIGSDQFCFFVGRIGSGRNRLDIGGRSYRGRIGGRVGWASAGKSWLTGFKQSPNIE